MKERIKEIVGQVLRIAVDDETSQETCAVWDSLRHLSLIIELEMAFDVSFEPKEIAQMKSIDTIERMLRAKM
jgi:acyl carrier protein